VNETASDDQKTEDILSVLPASAGRRWMGIIVFFALGVLLLWLGIANSPSFGWRIGFIVFGMAALWGADVMRRSTADEIVLTREVLRTRSGRVLTRVDNVDKVERGAFAFKPSQGFLVRLKTPTEPGWAPGLWWARGTYVGIGGVVSGGQAKAMAEILTAASLNMLPSYDDD
jgi:hypothetical protein